MIYLTPMVQTTHKTLGILGGGQLGQMSAIAAEKLGISCVIFTPEENSPAAQVSTHTIIADYTDESALRKFAEQVDVITYEFENIPLETIQFLKTLKPVYPDENLLEVAQDRIREKTFLNNIGIKTAKWKEATSPEIIPTTLGKWNTTECILKTIRFGYDGKGQSRYNKKTDNIRHTWDQLGGTTLIIEEIIPFDCEISIIIARDIKGNTQTYGPMINEHKDHILSRTTIPADLPDETCKRAIEMAKTIANTLNLRGILTLELFLTKDGDLLANEIAPRTHNSGHWSIDACPASQFENHVRAVCGLPLGNATPHSAAEMINLIGDDIEKAKDYEDIEGAFTHLYGKSETRKGRKMGHITILKK